MFAEKLTPPNVHITRTAIINRVHHTALRLWVPYEQDATQPMDFPHEFKYSCDYLSPWYTAKELKRIAENSVRYTRIGMPSGDPEEAA